MASYDRKLHKILKAGNCRFLRNGKGSHVIWVLEDGTEISLPKSITSRHTANEILKQAGLEKEF